MPDVQIDWGDGTTDVITVPPGDWLIEDEDHTYATRGSFLITATGPDGGFSTAPVSITGPTIIGPPVVNAIASAAPTLVLNRPPDIGDGDLIVACLRGQTNNAGNNDYASPGFVRQGPAYVSGDSTKRAISIQIRPVVESDNEPATYTFTRNVSSRGAGALLVIRGAALPVAGTNPTYGGTEPALGARQTAAFPTKPPSLQVFAAGGEFSAGVSAAVLSKPAGMTQQTELVSPGDTTVSRTSLWVGTANADAAQAPAQRIDWATTVQGAGAASVALKRPSRDHLFTDVSQMLATPGFTWAHRGNSTYFAELSRYAYENAAARGYGVLEFSAARSSDGVWFGLHDEDINRVAGTTGLPVASLMSWAEINSHQITNSTDGIDQPFYRLDDFLAEWSDTHLVIIDPKYAWALGGSVRQEFWDLLALVDPTRWMAKGFITSASLATAASGKGVATWGYAYATDIANGAVAANQALWTALGLEYTALQADWTTIKSYGKKVIAHVAPDQPAYVTARSKGADGVQCGGSDVILPVAR